MSSHASVIALKGVTKRYNDVLAVDDLSLSVKRGTMLVLLGSSGCGKTTTLRLMAGLESPDDGEIWLDGKLVAGKGVWIPPESRKIGMVFQDYALFPHLSSSDNIAFPLHALALNQRSKRVDELLALVGMEGMADRYPHQLSGGQQQRVALARALAPSPAVVLLDEPFSNLDAALRAQVRGEVRDILKRAGTTSVFVTHDQEEALSLSDHIAVMFGGRLAQIGPPQEVYMSPASREVASFVGEANFLPAEADGARAASLLGDVPLSQSAHGAVDLLLRPENLTLSSINGATESVPQGVGQVQWVDYYGHDQRVGVQMKADTDEPTLLVVRAGASKTYTPGERVKVRVNQPVQTFTR